MNPQMSSEAQRPVTMFLKPSFLITAQGNGLKVSVSLALPPVQPQLRN